MSDKKKKREQRLNDSPAINSVDPTNRPVYEYSRGGRRKLIEPETKVAKPVETSSRGKKTEGK